MSRLRSYYLIFIAVAVFGMAAWTFIDVIGRYFFNAPIPGSFEIVGLILGISMIGVSEAFVLAEKLGLDRQKLFDISSTASGQCWSLTTYCPVPGPVPTSPANRDYQPGFSAAMMLKDLKLSQAAAQSASAATPIGAEATSLYELFVNNGNADTDFSGIVRFLRGGEET